jgi:hypothetical protein
LNILRGRACHLLDEETRVQEAEVLLEQIDDFHPLEEEAALRSGKALTPHLRSRQILARGAYPHDHVCDPRVTGMEFREITHGQRHDVIEVH